MSTYTWHAETSCRSFSLHSELKSLQAGFIDSISLIFFARVHLIAFRVISPRQDLQTPRTTRADLRQKNGTTHDGEHPRVSLDQRHVSSAQPHVESDQPDVAFDRLDHRIHFSVQYLLG